MKMQLAERTKQPRKGRKTNTYLTLSTLKNLLITLEKTPMTQQEIIENIGICNSTVSRWIARLHQKPGLIYIHSYRRIGTRGNWTKVWAAGYYGIDAVKPAPLGSGEYQKRWRRKKELGSQLSQPEQGVIRHVAR